MRVLHATTAMMGASEGKSQPKGGAGKNLGTSEGKASGAGTVHVTMYV